LCVPMNEEKKKAAEIVIQTVAGSGPLLDDLRFSASSWLKRSSGGVEAGKDGRRRDRPLRWNAILERKNQPGLYFVGDAEKSKSGVSNKETPEK